MSKIIVMGAGSWGTTIAILLAEKNNEVVLWEFDSKKAEEISRTRENPLFLKGKRLPDNVLVTSNIDNLLDGVEYIVMAIPSQFLRSVISKISTQIKENMIIVNLAKGIEIKSHKRMSEIIKEELLGKFHKNIVALSGPTHAEEVSERKPSAIVAACENIEVAKKVQELFNTDYFRVYAHHDIVGVEIGAALKNCIAIAAGICDGFGFGDNSKSAIMTRGLLEMTRFGLAFGAEEKTFSGLTGIGDLITTCTSRHSRNRFVGEKIGSGEKIDDILKSMVMVAEGVPTIKAVYEIAQEQNIYMPIISGLYNIIYLNSDPKTEVIQLMTRELKEEFKR